VTMAISGKPPKPAPPSPAPRAAEQEVMNLIHKGGSVPKSAGISERDAAKPMLVQLRLYPDLVEEIDGVRKNRAGKKRRPPSRHAWIVEAIEEKLARERQNT
jgi:hypothetical protein